MQQRVLDFNAAKKARDEGRQRAVDHADRVIDGWQEMALEAFEKYAKTHVTFTTEQVRVANPQIPEPPDKRAWGAVAKRALKEQIVQKIGMVQAKSPKVHCMYVTLYESRVLDLNAKLDETEWKKLARNYARAFRMNVKREGFIAVEVMDYARKLGCPRAPESNWWIDVLVADGLEWDERRNGWFDKACCPECAEARK